MRNVVSVDLLFTVARFTRRIALWSQSTTVKWIQLLASSSLPIAIVPEGWKTWADERQNDILQSMTLDWTEEAVHTLLDVHGYQILNQGLFSKFGILYICLVYHYSDFYCTVLTRTLSPCQLLLLLAHFKMRILM